MSSDGGVKTAPTPPVGEAAAVWEDFIDIHYAPGKVYERRRGRPPWPMLGLLTVVLGVLFFAWQQLHTPLLDLEMQRAVAERSAGGAGPTPDQMEQMARTGRIFGLIGFVIAFPFGVLLTGLVTWGLARFFGAAATFAASLLVVTYAQIVRIAQFTVGLLQGWVLDLNRHDSVHDVSFSLARFLDQPETSSPVVNLAARVDLFTLWATALIAIGLSVVIGMSRASAWGAAILVWLLAALPTVMGSLIGG